MTETAIASSMRSLTTVQTTTVMVEGERQASYECVGAAGGQRKSETASGEEEGRSQVGKL